MSNFTIKLIFTSNFKLYISITILSATILTTISYQTSSADLIVCERNAAECNGTAGDDSIWGSRSVTTVINGLDGNDYIQCFSTDPRVTCSIFGGNGNDTLIGGHGNDGLYGMKGNDRYDGSLGDDTILESSDLLETLVSNDDIISGSEGNDFLVSGAGADIIHSGPGNDRIDANSFHRDFSRDVVDCGSDGDLIVIYSGDGDAASNCENIINHDR